MQRKIAIRLIIGLIVMAGLFVGYRYLKDIETDPLKVETMDSAGWVAAIEEEGDGSHAVVFDANGKKMVDKAWKSPTTEDSVSWMPDGNRLVFSSDRGGRSQNLYYWIPTKEITEKFKEQGRSMSAPWFGPNDPTQPSGLMLSGGNVWEFVPRNKIIRQVLPPLLRTSGGGEEEGGATSSMEALYKNFGNSFKDAVYISQRGAILTVMRRDEGEVAVLNFSELDPTGKPRMPVAMTAGQRVEITSSDSATGTVMVIHDFQWTNPDQIPDQYKKDGKTTRPYKNAIVVLANPLTEPQPKYIGATAEESPESFGFPAISPDGSVLAIVVSHTLADNKSEPVGLFLVPVKEGGVREAKPLIQGDISQPSWSPDGKKLCYIKHEDGKNSLYTVNIDGSGESRLAEGNFSQPKFSPQTPKAK